MKTILVLVMFLGIFLTLSGVVRESTPEGGVWTAPATWVGGIVPAATDDVVINGSVDLNAHPACNNLTINFIGVLQNAAGLNYTLAVNGDFTNHGNCLNNSGGGNLDLDLRGNFSNYYVIANRFIYLRKSSGIMNLYNDEDAAPIDCQQFLGQSTAIGYRLLSNLEFNEVQVDFYNKDVFMFDGTTAYDIALFGGKLYRAVLKNSGISTLSLDLGAYLDNVDGQNIMINGQGLIYQSVFFDKLTLDYYSSITAYTAGTYNLTVRHELKCYGTISNGSSGNIYLKLYGDLYNYYLINCYFVHFMGTGTQSLFQSPGAAAFMNNTFGKPSGITSGELVLLSDLRTLNTTVDMNSRNLVCHSNGQPYNLSIDGGFLYRVNLLTNGFSRLTMVNGAYLNYVNAGDFILDGTTMPYTEVYFDDVVNQGIIQSYYGINHFVVNGVLHNWYNIIDAVGSDLYLHLKSDLYNNGNINCYNIYMDGPGNQYLQLGGGVVFQADHKFLISNWGNAQFWLNDTLVYQGNTYFNINDYSLGVWKIVAGSNERYVTLGEGSGVTLPTPEITSFTKVDDVVKLVWNEIPGAFYYLVYEANDPYGDYMDFYYAWDDEPSDGIVTYQVTPTLPKRFYKVYAHH